MPRPAKLKPPRERAARALCSFYNIPENITYKGRPMWMQYLPEADAVLEAALSPEEWERVKSADQDNK